MTATTLPRRTTTETAAARRAHLSPAEERLFLYWYRAGWSDEGAGMPLDEIDHRWRRELTELSAPAAALAGYIEGLAARRAEAEGGEPRG